MKLFPAIDLKDGRVVRLLKGDYGKVERYEIAPADAARDFYDRGARYLHVVDLDGARDGTLSNYDVIAQILRAADMFIEVGGGIRDEARIERYLEMGASRVILGTAAVNDFAFLTRAVRAYGERVAVGVDAHDGFVAVDGWTTVTKLDGVDFCRRVRDIGVKTVIYTDIARDGALAGTNLEIYETLRGIEGLDIVASGGISAPHELERLREMGLYGVIVGKAIYAGRMTLEDALAAASGQGGGRIC